MMIAHLFNKVYLSFDILFQPAFDTLIVSTNHYAPHSSFINQHIGMGTHHGNYNNASQVPWQTFFNSVNDRRTIVFVDPMNFAVIYFSYLKTIKQYIKKSRAIKLLEIILKRTEFCFVEYDHYVGGLIDAKREGIARSIAEVRQCYDQAWLASERFDLPDQFVQENIGIEFLIAQYWADGRKEELVKQKLEQMWWKCFVYWGEEYMKMYTFTWLYRNPTKSYDEMLEVCARDPNLYWIADPNLSVERVEEFKQTNTWTTIVKIWNQILGPNDGLEIQLIADWQTVVNQDWSKILDRTNPMPILAVATEPTYRILINGWLISYFASQSSQTLKDMVI